MESENNEYSGLIEFYRDQLNTVTYFNKRIGISDEALFGKHEDDYDSIMNLLSEDRKFILDEDSSVISIKNK